MSYLLGEEFPQVWSVLKGATAEVSNAVKTLINMGIRRVLNEWEVFEHMGQYGNTDLGLEVYEDHNENGERQVHYWVIWADTKELIGQFKLRYGTRTNPPEPGDMGLMLSETMEIIVEDDNMERRVVDE